MPHDSCPYTYNIKSYLHLKTYYLVDFWKSQSHASCLLPSFLSITSLVLLLCLSHFHRFHIETCSIAQMVLILTLWRHTQSELPKYVIVFMASRLDELGEKCYHIIHFWRTNFSPYFAHIWPQIHIMYIYLFKISDDGFKPPTNDENLCFSLCFTR